MSNRKIILTEDGSSSLFVPELNEQYHSVHGAIQESMHVFIQAGLAFVSNNKTVNVFEVGFGTGLNALLTYQYCLKNDLKAVYHSVEKYPLPMGEVEQLNYPQQINTEGMEEYFNKIHQANWNQQVMINSNFSLLKTQADLRTFVPPRNYHLVYFDAFGPDKQPDLWTVTVFKQLYGCLLKGGVLVTYSAKGTVRRSLIEVGFKVERIPGPPGKREMIRAIKV